jgi:hypothetical protein
LSAATLLAATLLAAALSAAALLTATLLAATLLTATLLAATLLTTTLLTTALFFAPAPLCVAILLPALLSGASRSRCVWILLSVHDAFLLLNYVSGFGRTWRLSRFNQIGARSDLEWKRIIGSTDGCHIRQNPTGHPIT